MFGAGIPNKNLPQLDLVSAKGGTRIDGMTKVEATADGKTLNDLNAHLDSANGANVMQNLRMMTATKSIIFLSGG